METDLKSELKILLMAKCNDTIDKTKNLTILSAISKQLYYMRTMHVGKCYKKLC